jgi:hypothetical protein
MKRFLVGAVWASLAGLLSIDASAAIQNPCAPATVTPAVASVPANLPAFGYTALKATTSDVHLHALDAAKTEIPLTLGPVVDGYLKVVPAALTVGASYQLDFQPFCSYGPYPPSGPLTFTVAAAAPLPTQLGAVLSPPTVVVRDFGTTKFTITTTYAIADEMKPWQDVYRLGLTFDGKPIETKITPAGADGSVNVVATGWCDEAAAAKPAHDVALRARLPFAPALETTASTLTFDCPAPNIVTPKPGPIALGSRDAQGNEADGSTSSARASGSPESGGCSVAAHTRSSSAASAIVMALGVAAFLRRRRHHRTTTGEA